MNRLYLDTETIGFHGVPVIVQYAVNDGQIYIHNFWTNTIDDNLDLLESFLEYKVVGFNLTFDWFHLYKIWTMFRVAKEQGIGGYNYPDGLIDEFGVIEEQARFYDYCYKPHSAIDLMLLARKGPFQSLMKRDPVRIRRVPTQLAHLLAQELENRVQFDDIYFAKAKNKSATRWKVLETKNPAFKDVQLHFSASGALKPLYFHIFQETENQEEIILYKDIKLDHTVNEAGYAPFAKALAPKAPIDWNGTWPDIAMRHINHWESNEKAREYAANDVKYTRRLDIEYFKSPESDIDSTLACMVACCRWKGYTIDKKRIIDLKVDCLKKLGFNEANIATFKEETVTSEIIKKFGRAIMAPIPVKKYLLEVMDETEALGLSTKRTVLEEIAKWQGPAGDRAKEVLAARQAKKEIENYDKLLTANRFHASFKVGGTLSGRMSGNDDLNAQGIKHQDNVREAFPLADRDKGEILCGGDFKAFEVSIAAKVFEDKDLDRDLQSGIQIHAIFATMLFPEFNYDQIVATKGKDPDYYDKGKKGIFAIFYGGESYTLTTRLGVTQENADKSFAALKRKYLGIAKFGYKIQEDFGALVQQGGLGTRIDWHEPKEYVESFLGFKRYFTLENRVTKALYDLARDTPKSWKNLQFKVVRRDRLQTGAGATSSALYGAAFGIVGRNIRAAKNHMIQSPGAEVTKATQAAIWELQPIGVAPWIVSTLNVHDEIMVATRKGYETQVKQKADATVAYFQNQIPLLKIDWFTDISNWASKKGVIAV